MKNDILSFVSHLFKAIKTWKHLNIQAAKRIFDTGNNYFLAETMYLKLELKYNTLNITEKG